MRGRLVAGVALALVLPALASASAGTPSHQTTLSVGHVDVDAGALTVSGLVESDDARCELLRVLKLVRVQENSRRLLDFGFSSFRGAWSLHSLPGTADGSEIDVVVLRQRVPLRHHRHIVCEKARLPIKYPL
jgi:hypothetical protein